VSRVMQDVERRTAGVKAAWLTRRPPARPGWRRRVGVGAMLLVAGSAFALMWRLSRAPSGVPVAVPTETRVMPPMPPLRLLTPSPTDLAPGTPGVSTGETSELFVFDFENGATPAALRSGAVVPGPPRPGNGFVAIGGLSEWEPQANIIQIEFSDIDRRLHFSDRIVVTFDVWAGGEVGRLTVQSYNEARRHNFHLGFSQIARGRWLHVTVRLADLVANDPSKVVAIPGDVLNNFLIIGGRLPGGGLYVDNIRVVEFRQGAALPPTRVEDAN